MAEILDILNDRLSGITFAIIDRLRPEILQLFIEVSIGEYTIQIILLHTRFIRLRPQHRIIDKIRVRNPLRSRNPLDHQRHKGRPVNRLSFHKSDCAFISIHQPIPHFLLEFGIYYSEVI